MTSKDRRIENLMADLEVEKGNAADAERHCDAKDAEIERLRADLKCIAEYQPSGSGSFEYYCRKIAIKSLAGETSGEHS